MKMDPNITGKRNLNHLIIKLLTRFLLFQTISTSKQIIWSVRQLNCLLSKLPRTLTIWTTEVSSATRTSLAASKRTKSSTSFTLLCPTKSPSKLTRKSSPKKKFQPLIQKDLTSRRAKRVEVKRKVKKSLRRKRQQRNKI